MSSSHFHPVSSALSYLSHNQTHFLSDVFSTLLSSLLLTLLTFAQPNSTFRCLLSTSIQSPHHSLSFHPTQMIHFQMCSQPFYPVASLSSSLLHNPTNSLS